MADINLADVITIVLAQMPVDKGHLIKNAAEFFDTPFELVIEYNTMAVPYIPYTEEKWISKRWKGKKNPNEGWISKKTTGQLNRYGWSNTLGLPFDMSESNEKVLANQDKLLEQMGVIQNV